jgi:hypothetical protein
MYTATVFEKKSKTTHAWQLFQGKINIWNGLWTCEWKVCDRCKRNCEWKVTDRVVRWSDTSENVLRQLQIIQLQHAYVINSQKSKTFRSYPFKTFPAQEVRFSWNFQKRLKRVSLHGEIN